MARSERQVPSVYFGRPGGLVTLPWPVGGITKPYERQTFDFTTGSGQHAVYLQPGGSRPFGVNWNALHLDNYDLLKQFWTGANGSGPWTLIDPSVPNMLLPNQAAATGLYNDATGLSTATGIPSGGTILSATGNTHRTLALRSIRWQFTVTPSSTPTMIFNAPYRNWTGIPAVPGLVYTWNVWAKPDGVVDSSITMAAKLQWYDAAGGLLSDWSSGDVVMTGWTRIVCTATAPANTAYVRPVLVTLGSTITTGGSIYIDEPNLEQDSVANVWAPGTGVRPVEILSLPDVVPFETRMRTDISMSLRELAE